MSDWVTDLRAVLRSWRRAPVLSATVVLTLALGLGLASAIFSFADGYLFRPLPFPDADRNYFVRDPNAAVAGALKATADGRARTVRLTPLVDAQTRGGQPTARLLLAGAVLILALVTINLVHLLLTRAVARGGEIATRAALGAGRWRLARLFLVESVVVAALGIGAGLLLGLWLSKVIEARIPQWPTAGRNMAMVPMIFDARVAGVAIALGVLVAGIGGVWPALRASRVSLHYSSRGSGGVATSVGARTSIAILISEVAVATVVTVGALFIGGGIWQFLHQPLGFDYVDRWGVSVNTSSTERPTATDVEAIVDAIRSVPGVRAVSPRYTTRADAVGVPSRALPQTEVAAVGMPEGYAETWNLRLRAGRWFDDAEYAADAPVAIVDERFARLAWPDEDAIGRDVRIGPTPRTVVGVIEPKRESLLRETRALAYVPSRLPPSGFWLVAWAPRTTATDLQAAVAAATAPLQPGADVRVEALTFDDLFLRDVGEARFQAPIVAAFGLLTFALVAIGVFGLVSYLVAQRTREFGVRIALGARPRDIGAGVIRRTMTPALAGVTAGIGGAWLLESIVRATMFGWAASSRGAAFAAAAGVVVVVLAAALLPARRAMRVDPSQALRAE